MGRLQQSFILCGGKDHVQIELVSDVKGKFDKVETTYISPGVTSIDDMDSLDESINLVNFTGSLRIVRNSAATKSENSDEQIKFNRQPVSNQLSRNRTSNHNVNVSGIKKVVSNASSIVTSNSNVNVPLSQDMKKSTRSHNIAENQIVPVTPPNPICANRLVSPEKGNRLGKFHKSKSPMQEFVKRGACLYDTNERNMNMNRVIQQLSDIEYNAGVRFGEILISQQPIHENLPSKDTNIEKLDLTLATEFTAKNIIAKNHDQSCGKSSSIYSLHDTTADERIVVPGSILSGSPDDKSEAESTGMTKLRLHEMCAEPSITLTKLEKCLSESQPDIVSTPDSLGRLPLHILADNDALVSTAEGKLVASTFALHLMRLYPAGITMYDDRFRMPFVRLIECWSVSIYQKYDDNSKKNLSSAPSLFNKIKGRIESNSLRIESLVRELRNNKSFVDSQATIVTGDFRKNLHSMSTKKFPTVEVWDEVEWCFMMLSTAMDELGGKNGRISNDDNDETAAEQVSSRVPVNTSSDPRAALATHILTVIPNLVKTVLLINQDGGQVRERLLNMSVFRRLLVCPESVGPWLTVMLRRKGIPAKLAVKYLVLVSNLTIDDYVGGFRTVLDVDHHHFKRDLTHLFDAIENLDDTIASLVVLDNRDVEHASNTAVVWHIMSKHLTRPFLVGIVLMDFVLHVTLMMAFRTEKAAWSDGSEPGLNSFGTVPTQAILLICTHYIIRKVCEALSLLALSVGVFRGYFTSMWTLLDIATNVLTLVAVLWRSNNQNAVHGGANAFITGLLWVKILGFLKVINRHMATFIMSLTVILQDLRYFFIVLIVFIFMFGDMMTIVVQSYDGGHFCEENNDGEGPLSSFCSPERRQAYLRVYSLFLGDFEFDDYRETPGTTILFVLFTLIGVVIILNVLIALISDSYEASRIRSAVLFGLARVSFIAKHEAMEKFLRPGNAELFEMNMFKSRLWFVSFFSRVFKWVMLLSLLATAMYSLIFLFQRTVLLAQSGNDWYTFICVSFLCVNLALSIWLVSSFALEGSIQIYEGSLFNRCTKTLAKKLSERLFGSFESDDMRGDEEWKGRMHYLARSIERSQLQTKRDVAAAIAALEKRICEKLTKLSDDNVLC